MDNEPFFECIYRDQNSCSDADDREIRLLRQRICLRQADVVREGVVQIGVTFRVSKKWLNKFSAYKKLASITVGYLDMETMNIVNTQMYIDGYQVKLVSDTSYGSLWEVSFTLKEF